MKIINLIKLAMGAKRWDKLPLKDFAIQKIGAPVSADSEGMMESDQVFATTAGEAETTRDRCVDKAMAEYGVTKDVAKQMALVWAAYHPDYGGTTVIIAPYSSVGFIHGSEHVQSGAIDKYYLGIKRTIHKTPDTVKTSTFRNARKYNEKFDVDLQPADLQLIIAREPVMSEEDRKIWFEGIPGDASHPPHTRAPKKTMIQGRIPNLDPIEGGAFENYFKGNDIELDDAGNIISQKNKPGITPTRGAQALMMMNARGYDKFLRKYVGEWYQKAINEFAARFNMSPEEILSLAMNNEETQSAYVNSIANLDPKESDRLQVQERERRKDVWKNFVEDKVLNPEDFSMEILCDRTRDILREAATAINSPGNTQEERQRALAVKIPQGISRVKEHADERGTVNLWSEKEGRAITYFPNGDMPAYKEKTLKIPFGAAGATGVAHSKKEMLKQEALRLEIQQIMTRNSNRPELLTADNIVPILLRNPKRARTIAKGDNLDTFKEEVDNLISQIKENINIPVPAQQVADGLKETESYHSDLASACNEAKLRFSQDVMSKDDVTGARLGKPNPRMVEVFSVGYNITEEQLKKMREIKASKGRGENVEEFPISEVQEQEVKTPEKTQKQLPAGNQPTMPAAFGPGAQPANGEVLIPEVLGPNDNRGPRPSTEVKKIIASTLKSLITIAAEMDKEGKDDAAEEIHKVIRKYQGRM